MLRIVTGRCGVHCWWLRLMGPEIIGPGVHIGGVQPSRVQHKGIESTGVAISVAYLEGKERFFINN